MAESAPKGQPNGKIRVSLDLSPKMFELLEQMEKDTDNTKSAILRSALALMEQAIQANKDGNRLGIVNKDGKVLSVLLVI